MDKLFEQEFSRLAPNYAPRLAEMYPDVSQDAATDSLIAMGMVTMVLLQGQVEELSRGRLLFSIEQREQLGLCLTMRSKRVTATGRLSPSAVWQTLLTFPDSQLIRPETANLLRKASLRPEHTDPTSYVYQLFAEALGQQQPWWDIIRRHALLPVTMIEIQESGKFFGQRAVIREAERRVELLYPGEVIVVRSTGDNDK